MPNLAQPDWRSQLLWALSPGNILVSWVLNTHPYQTAQAAGLQVSLSHNFVDLWGSSEQGGCVARRTAQKAPLGNFILEFTNAVKLYIYI